MKYGDQVKITQRYKRRKYIERHSHYKVSFNTEGIFLGYRTLSDGNVKYYDEYQEYVAAKYYKVALVSPGPLKNPVYVPLESIENDQHSFNMS